MELNTGNSISEITFRCPTLTLYIENSAALSVCPELGSVEGYNWECPRMRNVL